MASKFPLGQIVITPGAADALDAAGEIANDFLKRHKSGDWGNVSREDAQENEFAMGKHLRVLSSYPVGNHDTLWIITEADRSATTLLTPDEY